MQVKKITRNGKTVWIVEGKARTEAFARKDDAMAYFNSHKAKKETHEDEFQKAMWEALFTPKAFRESWRWSQNGWVQGTKKGG